MLDAPAYEHRLMVLEKSRRQPATRQPVSQERPISIVAVAGRSELSVSAVFGTGMMQYTGAARGCSSPATLANFETPNRGLFRRGDRSRRSRAAFDEGVQIEKSECADERPEKSCG